MWNQQEAVEFAEASALTAWDQRSAHADFDEAISTYFDNLRDTLTDNGVTDQYVIAEAERAFHQRADELFGATVEA